MPSIQQTAKSAFEQATKPSWKSREFWGLAAIVLSSLGVLSGYLKPEDQDKMTETLVQISNLAMDAVAMLVMGAAGIAFNNSRSNLKGQVISLAGSFLEKEVPGEIEPVKTEPIETTELLRVLGTILTRLETLEKGNASKPQS